MLARWASKRTPRKLPRVAVIQTPPPSRPIHAPRKRTCIQHVYPRPQARGLFTSAIPTVLVPPVIFISLLLGLWTWKCFWIVLMQDKLLYISWLPPFARSEQISDYAGECGPVIWAEKQIRSLDGTKLAVCEGRIRRVGDRPARRRVVVCYFQGNGGSTPMRLPLLSRFLRTVSSGDMEFIAVALSYRGYWKSAGRATQSGIERDALAFLDWVREVYSAPDTDLRVILWGHSLGSAIASTAVASYLTRSGTTPIAGLILEAPVSSTKDMLISLYPQRWLPYRYLWPLLWNNWSSAVAMQRMARWRDSNRGQGTARSLPPILLLSAEHDEVIPSYAAVELEDEGKRLGLDVERVEVAGAMHTEIPDKTAGRKTMVEFILRCTGSTPDKERTRS